MRRLRHLLAFKGEDRPALRHLAPIFALIGAANIVTASFSKSLFLDHNSYDSLPWAVLGMSAFTAMAAAASVRLVGRWPVQLRFHGLLLLAGASLALLGSLLPLQPRLISLGTVIVCTGLGNLLLLQCWSYSAALLPVRQARRLFPLLAASATIGGATGGLLLRGLLPLGLLQWLWLLAALLWLAILPLLRRKHGLGATADQPAPPSIAPAEEQVRSASSLPQLRTSAGEPRDHERSRPSLLRHPLLLRLAALGFFLQAAATLVDYQFLSVLKQGYDAEGMAGFLGAYYAAANLLTVVLALGLGPWLARWLPLGLATGASALVLAAGGLLSLLANRGEASSLFWIVVATSFAERVLGYALVKHAFQAASMPLPSLVAEKARFWIEGLGQRLAGVMVSLVILAGGWDLSQVSFLSLPLLLAGAAGLLFALGIGPAYRNALLEGLRSRKLASSADGAEKGWLQQELRRGLAPLLFSSDGRTVRRALDLAGELELGFGRSSADLDGLLRHPDDEVVGRAIVLANRGKVPCSAATLASLLEPSRSVAVLRGTLHLVPERYESHLQQRVEELVRHRDPTVAFLAHRWLRRLDAAPASPRQDARPAGTHPAGPAEGELTSGLPLLQKLLQQLGEAPLGERRLAVATMAGLGLEPFLRPLLLAMSQPALRDPIHHALRQFQPEAVLQEIAALLRAVPPASAALRIFWLRLASLLEHPERGALLVGQLGERETLIRSQAAYSLWRLTLAHPELRPPGETLLARLEQELEGLCQCLLLEQLLEQLCPGELVELLRVELPLLRQEGEDRFFRLLAVLRPDEGAIERVHLAYRAADRRARSMAIELLDTMLKEPALRPFVGYLEACPAATGLPLSTSINSHPVYLRLLPRFLRASAHGPAIESLVPDLDPWLQELLRSFRAVRALAGAGEDDERGASMSQDVIERVISLRATPLFEGIRAELLLPLAEVAEETSYAAGQLIVQEGEPGHHLYLLLAGEVEVLRGQQVLTRLRQGECFGELSVLAPAPRSATVRACGPVRCIRLDGEDFADLLDLSPLLARGIIQVLARRLRETTERQAPQGAESEPRPRPR